MIYRRRQGGPFHFDFQYNGQRFRGSTKQTNEKKAQMYEAQKLMEARDGLLGIKKTPVLKDYAKQFESYIAEQRLDTDTKRYYANGLRILLDSRYAKQKLDAIKEYTPAEGVGNATANCVVRTLRRLLNKAKQEGLVRDVPSLKNFEDRHRNIVYDDDLANKIVTMAPQPLRDVFLCVWQAGMRPEEVYRMRLEWIDWNNRVVNVPDGKTKNSRRTIPISDRLLDALVVRCAEKKVRKTGWMFPARNKQSKSGHVTNVAKQWLSCRKDLGLSREAVLYSARHTFGTNVYSATGNLKLVMNAMGHSDTKTAMRYQHPAIEQLRDVLNKKTPASTTTDGKDRRVM